MMASLVYVILWMHIAIPGKFHLHRFYDFDAANPRTDKWQFEESSFGSGDADAAINCALRPQIKGI